MPAGADGRVNEHRTRSVGSVAGQRGPQQSEAAVEENGNMAETASDVRHDNTFPT